MELLLQTASLPGGSGQWNSPIIPLRPGGSERRKSCNAPPYSMGAMGSGFAATHHRAALWQRAVEILRYTTTLPGGSGEWNSCDILPHYLGALGSGFPADDCHAWGQCVVELLHYIAAVPWGSGKWNSCNMLPHCLGALSCG